MIRPFDVRWLSNFVAIDRLLTLYPAVIKALSELYLSEKDFLIESMKIQLSNSWNLMLLHTYADILSPLFSLTKQFQSLDINIENVQTSLSYCILALKSFAEKNLGVRATRFLEGCIHNEGKYSFKDITLVSSTTFDEESQLLKEKTKEIATILIKSLEKRFSQMDILDKFSCFNLNKIKSLNIDEISDFGEKKLKELTTFYKGKGFLKPVEGNANFQDADSHEFNKIALKEEYKNFKVLIVNEYHSLSNEEIYWKILQNISFQNISKFLKISLTLPLSSVQCERSFSRMNLIKTDLRTLLEEWTLDDLMLISMNGVEVDKADFRKAVDNWKTGKKRYFY